MSFKFKTCRIKIYCNNNHIKGMRVIELNCSKVLGLFEKCEKCGEKIPIDSRLKKTGMNFFKYLG